MTTESIWGQAVPGTVSYANPGSAATYGTIFTLSQPGQLTGIWYYSGSGDAVLPSKCGIWDISGGTVVAGTENDSPSWSGALGSGWIKCSYDGSVTLAASTEYITAVFWPGAENKGYQTGLSYGITSGIITAPVADGAGLKNAPFAAPSSWSIPDIDSGGGFNWLVDVEVTPASIPEFQATFTSADGNGTQTWSVVSSLNGGAAPVSTRVLPPSSPSRVYPHSFLVALPVEAGQGSTFGDPLATIVALGAHNQYNLTVMQPGMAISPWYANNPNDASVSQEHFVLDAVTWLAANFAVTGRESVYLLGFSKSGLGGSGLLFRSPSVFQAGAFWDLPAGMTDYDGTDPDFPSSPVGGGSSAVYGTSANFTSNYELSSGNLTAWNTASNFGITRRLWVGGYNTFQVDVANYHARLSTAGILHTYASVSASAHVWAPAPGWVGPALAALFPLPGGSLPAGII